MWIPLFVHKHKLLDSQLQGLWSQRASVCGSLQLVPLYLYIINVLSRCTNLLCQARSNTRHFMNLGQLFDTPFSCLHSSVSETALLHCTVLLEQCRGTNTVLQQLQQLALAEVDHPAWPIQGSRSY